MNVFIQRPADIKQRRQFAFQRTYSMYVLVCKSKRGTFSTHRTEQTVAVVVERGRVTHRLRATKFSRRDSGLSTSCATKGQEARWFERREEEGENGGGVLRVGTVPRRGVAVRPCQGRCDQAWEGGSGVQTVCVRVFFFFSRLLPEIVGDSTRGEYHLENYGEWWRWSQEQNIEETVVLEPGTTRRVGT